MDDWIKMEHLKFQSLQGMRVSRVRFIEKIMFPKIRFRMAGGKRAKYGKKR